DGHVTGVQTCALPISRSQKIIEAQQTRRAIEATQIEAKKDAEKALEEGAKNRKRIRKILEIAKYEQIGWTHGASSSIYEQPTLRSEEHTSELQSRGHL